VMIVVVDSGLGRPLMLHFKQTARIPGKTLHWNFLRKKKIDSSDE